MFFEEEELFSVLSLCYGCAVMDNVVNKLPLAIYPPVARCMDMVSADILKCL